MELLTFMKSRKVALQKETFNILAPVPKEPYTKISNLLGGYQFKYITSSVEATNAIGHLLTSKAVLGLDTETYALPQFSNDKKGGLDPKKSAIRTIQIYDGQSQVFIFDLLYLGGISILGEEIWKRPFIAHNGLFDLQHLIFQGVRPLKIGCTLLADRVLYGNRSKLKPSLGMSAQASLEHLAKEYLGIEISKEQQTSDWSQPSLSSEQIEYAALDAVLPVKLFNVQWSMLESRNLVRPYHIFRDAQYPVASMMVRGIGFKADEHLQMVELWSLESERLKDSIFDLMGCKLNLGSPKQLQEWLKEALKQEDLEGWLKTPKGQLSTSTQTLKRNEHISKVFPKLLSYRALTKRISSYGKKMHEFFDKVTQRLYGTFSLGKTMTGRMASEKPNMQNMPRGDFRSLFFAKEGYKLIGLDYSQQELRVAALLTQDQELLNLYAEGGDVHVNTASALMGIPKEKVLKEQRQLAKAVIFGWAYGMGARGLVTYAKDSYNVTLTEEEAKQHLEGLLKKYPGLAEWQKKQSLEAKLSGVATTPCGRIRDFRKEKPPEKKKDKDYWWYCESLNTPIQGGAAEITLIALKRLSLLIGEDCQIVNVVHDEIVLEVREEKLEEFAELAKEAMKQAFLDVFPNAEPYLVGLVEAKIGKNWAETK